MDSTLNYNSSVPLYAQIVDQLNHDIEAGLYSPSGRLPTEGELSKQYNVSRITIRRAVDELVSKGLVEKKKAQLQQAGIWVHTWETEPVPVTGQGAGMRPSDWSGKTLVNKDNQRVVYHLEVLADDQYQAMKILMESDGVELSEK